MIAAEKIKSAEFELKGDLAIGIEQLEKGHCQTYDVQNLIQLAEEIKLFGRTRLKFVK